MNWINIDNENFYHKWYYNIELNEFSWIDKQIQYLCYYVNDNMKHKFETQKQAANFFNISEKTLRKRIKEDNNTYRFENRDNIITNNNELITKLKKNTINFNITNKSKDYRYQLKIKDKKYIKIVKHRFIYYALNFNKSQPCNICLLKNNIFDMFNSKKYHIDHINNDHLDNSPNNLQKLCHSCHSKKTVKDNYKSIRPGQFKNVFAIVENTEEKIYFESVKEATEKTGVHRFSISESINKNKYVGSKNNEVKYKFYYNNIINEQEIWKETKYEKIEVSNQGNIRKKMKNHYKLLKCSVNNTGYKQASVKLNNLRKNISLHIILAETFIGNNSEKKVVDHINRDKLDNRILNLRYVSNIENSNNSSRIKKVQQIKDGNVLYIFINLKEAGSITVFDCKKISKACKSNNIYKDFEWRFE